MGPTKLFLCVLAAVPSFLQFAAAADGNDGLASESTDSAQQFVANLVEQKGGWIDAGVCAGKYCVHSNHYLAGGRGISLVTTSTNRIQMDRTENWLRQASINWQARDPPYEVKDLGDGRKSFVANATIKRGTNLMGFAPVLIVHKKFFDDVPKAEDQDRLLDAAVKLLPWATRQKFNAQHVEKSTGHKVRDIILAWPFELDMAYQTMPSEESNEKHYLNYPEAAAFEHDCRPNAAFYIDNYLAHRTVAARKIVPGEELTIAYTNMFLGRAARQAQYRKNSGDRLREIKDIETELKDHTSTHVTAAMIERLVELYKAERLQSKLSGPYQLAALNYNYLGLHKEAVRYANLASQAGIIEQGADSADALTMRILAEDPKGHYSWNQKDNYRGPNVGKKRN